MSKLKLGVIGTSRKVDEYRRPIHPEHLLNGTFQEPNNPLMFVTEAEKTCLQPGCLIIDVSCDEGMGFYFAKPTTFREPMFKVGKIDYYAVDRTPTYLWESATRATATDRGR